MITLDNLGVHLPQGYLFKNINLQINKGDKIGLVGKNGAGKSTLLKLLAKWNSPSEGAIHTAKDTKIGFLTQEIDVDTAQSVFDYLKFSNETLNQLTAQIDKINNALVTRTDYESASYLQLLDDLNLANEQFALFEGYQWEEKIIQALKGLGFAEEKFQNSLNTFSGGWKMRAELAKILVNQPDVILLDEPTNHLDIISIGWLEQYLQRYDGIVITISHDRLFLDNVTKRTLEIINGKILDFPFPYSKYKEKRQEEMERLLIAQKQQEKEIKRTEELIDKFRAKANKSAFAQSLIKKLDKTERIEVEKDEVAKMKIAFPLSVQPGKWVLEMNDFGMAFGDNRLYHGINLTVGRGEKIALLGPNGVGKSTLLKQIMLQIKGEGTINYGHNVEVTYFAQDQADSLNPDLTVLETVDLVAKGEIRKELRSVLGAFLFSGEDVDKKVAVLSGGERTRLALCQLLLSPSNVLILDEPTNHLDIQSKEVLKSALLNYEGTFIIVSHDREFLNGLTNRIWDIEDQNLKIHHFSLQEFLKRKVEKIQNTQPSQSNNAQKNQDETQSKSDTINDFERNKALKKERNKLKNSIAKSEMEIDQLESEIKKMDGILADLDYSDEAKANEQLSVYADLKKKLDDTLALWEEAQMRLEELKEK
ncbi:MAG: ABC-F family ATP-binding cassette domain-containing protein [Crocinitomicaceae bacterium]|nr:ABC-F family ATP-binding cassette domain-containing protein [Crocinitomicaceae bacterium]